MLFRSPQNPKTPKPHLLRNMNIKRLGINIFAKSLEEYNDDNPRESHECREQLRYSGHHPKENNLEQSCVEAARVHYCDSWSRKALDRAILPDELTHAEHCSDDEGYQEVPPIDVGRSLKEVEERD